MTKSPLRSCLLLLGSAALLIGTGCATDNNATEKPKTATKMAERTDGAEKRDVFVDEKGEYIWVEQGVASRVRKKVYIGKKEHTAAPVETVDKDSVDQMMNATRIPTPGS